MSPIDYPTNEIIIGIGEVAVTSPGKNILKTYALGSCVALILHDPQKGAGGMAHIALPHSRSEARFSNRPGYFADRGTNYLLQAMRNINPDLDPDQLEVYLIGGAALAGINDLYNIGENNVTVIKTRLSQQGYHVSREDTGGKKSRTVSLDVTTRQILIMSDAAEIWDL